MKSRPSGKPFGWTVLLFACLLACLPAGCGKKGPPVAPRALPLPVVADLEADVGDEVVRLRWSIPRGGGAFSDQLAGFHVYRSKVPLAEADCLDCPVPFERAVDVPMASALEAQGERYAFIYADPVVPGYRYIYKVRAHTATGAEGPASNLVEFIK